MILKNKNWMFISFGGLALSFLSLFLPVFYYTAGRNSDAGYLYSYNIIRIMDGYSLIDEMLGEYNGEFLKGLSPFAANSILTLLCLVGVAALVCSFVGLISMSKQYESSWPYRLTVAGIICTAVPALVLLIVVMMSNGAFFGTVRAGTYMYVTPLAMIASYLTVLKRHQLTVEELRIQREASKYIRPAGDLPLQ